MSDKVKKSPTYSLESIKKAFNKEEKLMMTYSAKQGQLSLGFSDKEVVDAVQALTEANFYKSMAPQKLGL